MVGLLGQQRLENTARLELIRVRLVRGRCGRGERNGVEDRGFGVRRMPHHELVHRAFVRDDARSLIFVLNVVEQTTDGVYVATLALGRGTAKSHCGVNGVPALR